MESTVLFLLRKPEATPPEPVVLPVLTAQASSEEVRISIFPLRSVAA